MRTSKFFGYLRYLRFLLTLLTLLTFFGYLRYLRWFTLLFFINTLANRETNAKVHVTMQHNIMERVGYGKKKECDRPFLEQTSKH